MTQTGLPNSDVSDGRWLNSAGNNTNLYSYIDEAAAYNDSDYIHVTDEWGSTDICTVGLGDITDPSSAALHKFTVRSKEHGGAQSVELTVTLLQNTTGIATGSTYQPGTSYANVTTTLTAAQANSITDYNDLRLKIQAVDQGGMGTQTSVTWAYFECPDASSPAATVTHSPAFLLFLEV